MFKLAFENKPTLDAGPSSLAAKVGCVFTNTHELMMGFACNAQSMVIHHDTKKITDNEVIKQA